MLYRDRKALYANVVNALGYVVILYWLINLAIYGWGRGPNLSSRAGFGYVDPCRYVPDAAPLDPALCGAWCRISGWFQAFLSIPRAVVGNAINFVATAMATKQFFIAEHSGKRVEWKKTAHVFPSAAQLMEHRRRLGDLLLENRLITLAQLQSALLAQQKAREEAGSGTLTELGYVSEEDLLAVLGRQMAVAVRQHRLPVRRSTVASETSAATPRKPCCPAAARSNGVLEVACADPAAPRLKKRLEEFMGCAVSLRLASESDFDWRSGRRTFQVKVAPGRCWERCWSRRTLLPSSNSTTPYKFKRFPDANWEKYCKTWG